MQILVAWDDANEAEMLRLYLSSAGNEVTVSAAAADLPAQARAARPDVLLLALTWPDADQGFAAFEQVRQALSGLPIVLACRQTEMFHLPRFLNHGLRHYLPRDQQADFVFLVQSSLESAVASTRAEEAHKTLQRLTDYLSQ